MRFWGKVQVVWAILLVVLVLDVSESIAAEVGSGESHGEAISGVVGGVIVPYDETSRRSLENIVAIRLSKVGYSDVDVSISALYSHAVGRRAFMDAVPAGSYSISGLKIRTETDEERWIDLRRTEEESRRQLSVLPDTLTDIGVLGLVADSSGIYSRFTLIPLAPNSGLDSFLLKHPSLNTWSAQGDRGWDSSQDASAHQLSDELRSRSPISGPPMKIDDKLYAMPTTLGDVAVHNPEDGWVRIRGPEIAQVNRLLMIDSNTLLSAGEAGLHSRQVGNSNHWLELPIERRARTVLDALLVGDRLILLVEERVNKETSQWLSGGRDEFDTTVAISILEMSWPEMDTIRIIDRTPVSHLLDVSSDEVVLTPQVSFIQVDDARYRWVRFSGEVVSGELTGVDRVYAQGRHVFVRLENSGRWEYMPDPNQPALRRELSGARPYQPPVVLSDGRILIYGRIMTEDSISPPGYYWSETGGGGWEEWSAPDTQCNRVSRLYVLKDVLYQHCRSGRIYTNIAGETQWEHQSHDDVPMRSDFPANDRETLL